MRWKTPIFAIVAVVLFFTIVEVLLWGVGVQTLRTERDPFQGFSRAIRVYQPDPARGVFVTPRRALAHSFNYQEFRIEKPPGGFRVFVLGGSSAFGFPWGASVAFSRVLDDALRAAYPDRPIEVVNAAAMSYGSHRLRILAHEVLEYEPDAVVIYGGHNEFVERRFYRDLIGGPDRLDRTRGLLFRSRLFSGMTRLYERAFGGGPDGTRRAAEPRDASMGELLGLDVNREESIVGAPEREEVVRLFAENLEAIVDLFTMRGVTVIVCTVPSNLSGWAPNESVFGEDATLERRQEALRSLARAKAQIRDGDVAAAADLLAEAGRRSPDYAEIHYRLAQALETLGREPEARQAYARARDADAQPSRAIGALNEAIRALAGRERVIVLDIEKVFDETSPAGIPGFDLFEDYVHPKPEGHRLIAYELWRVFLERGLLGPAHVADASRFREATGLDPLAVAAASDRPAATAEAKTPDLLFNLGVVLEHQERIRDAIEKYRDCIRLDPGHRGARHNVARLYYREGRFDEAVAEYREALRIEPGYVPSMVGLGETLRAAGRLEESESILRRATEADPDWAWTWHSLGRTLAQRRLLPEAEAAFRRGRTLDPARPELGADLAFALLFQGKLDEAEDLFRDSLSRRPDESRPRNGLAAVLTEQGRFDEAEALFRESLRLDPRDASARQGLEMVHERRSRER